MIRQLADTEGVKEGLKARNQLMWVAVSPETAFVTCGEMHFYPK